MAAACAAPAGAKDFLIDARALAGDMHLLDPVRTCGGGASRRPHLRALAHTYSACLPSHLVPSQPRSLPGPAPQVLASPKVLKVVHGGGNDALWLHRDFRLHLVNVFDTEKACQVGWLGGVGLRVGRRTRAGECTDKTVGRVPVVRPIDAPCGCPVTHPLLAPRPQVLGYRQRSLAMLLQRFCGIDAADKSLGQVSSQLTEVSVRARFPVSPAACTPAQPACSVCCDLHSWRTGASARCRRSWWPMLGGTCATCCTSPTAWGSSC